MTLVAKYPPATHHHVGGKKTADKRKLMPPAIKSLKVKTEVNDVRIYQVNLKNSGSVPLKNIPLRLIFTTESEDFMILSVEHKTSPDYEFGQIESDFSNRSQPRFIYSLLNPEDEDSITMLVNQPAPLNAFIKTDGISKSTLQQDDISRMSFYTISGFGAAIVFFVLLLQTIINHSVTFKRLGTT